MADTFIHFAIILAISSPWEIPARCVPVNPPPAVWAALKHMATQLELVGPHERWATDIRQELAYCHRHAHELAQVNAPRIADAERFPNAQRGLRWWIDRRHYLDCRRHAMRWHWDALTDEREDAGKALRVLELLAEAQCESNSWACRRRALAEVKKALGPDKWFEGRIE